MNHLHCHIYTRDDDFIRDIRAGGSVAEKAISCLYLKYRRQALIYFQKLVRSNPDYKGVPEDLAHDAFIVMIEKIRFESFPIKTLAGFWMGIGKHLLSNKLRRDSRIVLVQDPENVYAALEDPSVPSLLKDQDGTDWMERAFQQLEARCRTILLHWMEGYTMQEIAVISGLSSAAMARKHKYLCFKKLKEIIRNGNNPGLE